mmetsp:Transcript_5472/g.8627  ORF Transcript_5472/g.8627 Transcript_5472/m.8627 type:complete len:137 (-) Transcript_5472:283-693(-)
MIAPAPAKKSSQFLVMASVALNVVLLAGIAFMLCSANQVGAPLVRRAVSSRTAAPVRNLAAYAKPQKMTFQKGAKMAGLSAATSAALMQGVAQAAENAELIYQEGPNPPLVEFAWGMFGAMFTFSIALVVFGRSGL